MFQLYRHGIVRGYISAFRDASSTDRRGVVTCIRRMHRYASAMRGKKKRRMRMYTSDFSREEKQNNLL